MPRPPKFSAAFAPPSIPGLILWARADVGITLTSNKVSKWLDQSGHGNDLQSLVPNQPSYAISDPTLAGGNALVMAGAQKMNAPALLAENQPCTKIMIAYHTVLAGNVGMFDDNVSRQIAYIAAAGPQYAMDAGATLSGGAPNNAMHVFAFVFNGATSKIYVDGVAVATGAAGAGAGTGGQIIGTQSTGFMSGGISEVMIYNRALTPTEITTIGTYVASGRPSVAPQKALTADGNSIIAGDSAVPPSINGFVPLAFARFGGVLTNNAGLAGATTPQVNTIRSVSTDPIYSPLRPKNVNVMLEVTNDYLSGSTAAQCITHLATYVTNAHVVGWDVGMCTVLPSYVFADVAGGLADLATINTAIRGGATGADFIIDIAAQPIMGNVANINDPTYYVGRLHPTTLGHSLLVDILYNALVPRL